jgi:hypothetical protein
MHPLVTATTGYLCGSARDSSWGNGSGRLRLEDIRPLHGAGHCMEQALAIVARWFDPSLRSTTADEDLSAGTPVKRRMVNPHTFAPIRIGSRSVTQARGSVFEDDAGLGE